MENSHVTVLNMFCRLKPMKGLQEWMFMLPGTEGGNYCLYKGCNLIYDAFKNVTYFKMKFKTICLLFKKHDIIIIFSIFNFIELLFACKACLRPYLWNNYCTTDFIRTKVTFITFWNKKKNMLVFAIVMNSIKIIKHCYNNVIYYITAHPISHTKCYLKLKMVPTFFHYIKYTFIMRTIKNLTYYIHEHLSSVIYKS